MRTQKPLLSGPPGVTAKLRGHPHMEAAVFRLWQVLSSGSTQLGSHSTPVSPPLAFISRVKEWAQDAVLPQKQIRCSDSSTMVPGRGRERAREGGLAGNECSRVPGSVCWLPGNEEVNAGAELPADKSYIRGGQDGGSVCPVSLSTANAPALASLVLSSSRAGSLPSQERERMPGLTLGN